jgi:hypothetical protein
VSARNELLRAWQVHHFGEMSAGTVEAGSVEVAAGGANSMEALEAAVQPGTQLPGFVSAGIVQPGQADQAAAGLSHPTGVVLTTALCTFSGLNDLH